MDTPNFKLAISTHNEDRFSVEELEKFLVQEYNGSFSKIDNFYYEPKYREIHLEVATESILDKDLFENFIEKIKNSKFGEYFTW